MRIGEILVETQIITPKQLSNGLDYAKSKMLPIGRVLILLRYLEEEDLKLGLQAQQAIRAGMDAIPSLDAVKDARKTKKTFDDALKQRLNITTKELKKPSMSRSLDPTVELEKFSPQIADPSGKYMTSLDLIKLGDHFLLQDKVDDAALAFADARMQLENMHGKNDDAVSPAVLRLANLYLITNRFLEAEELYLQLLQIKQQKYGTDHPDIAKVLEELADLYQAREEYARAESFYLSAATIFEKKLPFLLTDFMLTLKKLLMCCKLVENKRDRKKLGELLVESGVISDAQLQQALKEAKQRGVPLGIVIRDQGAIDDNALKSLLEAQLYIKQGIMPGTVAIKAFRATLLSGISVKKLLTDAGLISDPPDDVDFMRLLSAVDELLVAEFGLGANHKVVAKLAFRVGELYETQGNLIDAEVHYKRAYAVWSADPCTSGDLSAAPHKLASVLMSWNRYIEAQPLLMNALEMHHKCGLSESIYALECLKLLAILEYELQNYPAAMNMFKSTATLAMQLDEPVEFTQSFIQRMSNCCTELGMDAAIDNLKQLLENAKKKNR